MVLSVTSLQSNLAVHLWPHILQMFLAHSCMSYHVLGLFLNIKCNLGRSGIRL